MQDMYNYPEYYDIVFKRDFKKDCDSMTKLFKKFSRIQVTKILDIACGTGRHMEELAAGGFKVAGLDISKRMLSITNKRLEVCPYFLGTYAADMGNFELPEKFDACICMTNSLGILLENEQIISHFDSVAKCLNPGGIYIIELDNPAFISSAPKLGEKPKEYRKTFKEGEVEIKVSFRRFPFDFENFLEKSELALNVNDSGKKIRLVNNAPIRRLTPTEIPLFVKLNGQFELLKILGGFNINSSVNDKNSGKMVVILRRK